MTDTPKDAMTAAEVIENALDDLEGYCESCRCDTHTMCAAHRAKQAILAALRGPGHPEPPAERRTAMPDLTAAHIAILHGLVGELAENQSLPAEVNTMRADALRLALAALSAPPPGFGFRKPKGHPGRWFQ